MMTYYVKIFDRDNYASHREAEADNACRMYTEIAVQDEYRFSGGFGLDILLAMLMALDMVGQGRRLGAVLVDRNNDVVDTYNC